MDNTWKNLLVAIKQRTSEHNFNRWFKPIRPLKVEDNNWTLIVKNRFLRDWITDNYIDILEQTLYEVTGGECRVKIVAENQAADRKPNDRRHPYGKKKTRKKSIRKPGLGLRLNGKLLFKTFVVGPSNEFAHAACRAVANEPGNAYNPLFLYGGTGLGKTHLIQAIANQIFDSKLNLRIAYLTAERFMTELIQSIKNNTMVDFRRNYRDKCDVLLMDDIQFIAGKTSTQEEFFHTFNFLFESGKQVVVTSDQYPQEIKTLDERIRSRLQSGLVADLKVPDMETRLAILKKKDEADGFGLPDNVLQFLATNFKSNVRELEGSYIRLKAFASLTNTTIEIETAKDILKEQLQPLPLSLSSENIQKRVSKYFDIKVPEMISKRRSREIVIPRQIAMFLIKKYTGLSLTEIGQRFGGKDHATVINSISRVEKMIAEDMNIRNSVEALEKVLEGQ